MVDPAATTEADTNAEFKIQLSAASGQSVTVDYDTSDGLATQPGDYTSASDRSTVKTESVAVTNDTTDEPDQTFKLALADTATNATVASDEEGTATISDDDAAPAVTVDDLTVAENGTADFQVRLSAPSEKTVTVGYATADGSALSGDYTGETGTVTFDPDDTVKTESVAVTNDTVDEPDETFKLTLADTATNATVDPNEEGTATITDDDGGPTVTVDDAPDSPRGTLGLRTPPSRSGSRRRRGRM